MEAVITTEKPAAVSRLESSRHIPALDGLRGLAILAVFFHHYGAGAIDSPSAAVRWIAIVCGFGWSGVNLFFVLSGFLITGILYDTQRDPGYYRKFYARRSLRIFPIYYLFATIALLIVPWHAWHKGDLFFLVYLGYPAALIRPSLVHLPIRITHLWSLQIEEQFYAVWPSLIHRLRKPSTILPLCAVLFVISLVLRIIFPGWASASLPCRMDDLGLGSAIAILFRTDLRDRCRRLALPVFAFASTAIILICCFRHTTAHADRVIYTVGFSLISLAYGSLLILTMGPLSGIFSVRILRAFGKYSYGMYLYHFPLTAVTEHFRPYFTRFPSGTFIYVGVCLAANFVIAALSFYVFEQPIMNLKKRFAYTKEGRDPSLAPANGVRRRFPGQKDSDGVPRRGQDLQHRWLPTGIMEARDGHMPGASGFGAARKSEGGAEVE